MVMVQNSSHGCATVMKSEDCKTQSIHDSHNLHTHQTIRWPLVPCGWGALSFWKRPSGQKCLMIITQNTFVLIGGDFFLPGRQVDPNHAVPSRSKIKINWARETCLCHDWTWTPHSYHAAHLYGKRLHLLCLSIHFIQIFPLHVLCPHLSLLLPFSQSVTHT